MTEFAETFKLWENSLVETTVNKCSLYKFSMRKAKYVLESDI